jgi:hypothetical protein
VITALWIAGAVLLVLLAGWRLRRASRTVDRILAEEADRSALDDTLDDAAGPADETGRSPVGTRHDPPPVPVEGRPDRGER